MLIVVGTVPLEEGIYAGEAEFAGKNLKVGTRTVPVERGTGALAASALRVMEQLDAGRPYCLLAGDRAGQGSHALLEECLKLLGQINDGTVVLHYMYVLLKYGRRLEEAVKHRPKKPYLIGDAGGMYLAKAGGAAQVFDLFTPDKGELAFLADSGAAHPMYTKPHFYSLGAEELAGLAWKQGNSPKTLVVKGSTDLVFEEGKCVRSLREPSHRAMEAVGGTGDTVTGMIAAFREAGAADGIYEALLLNRLAGVDCGCTPRTRIGEFIGSLDLKLLVGAGVKL